MTTTCHPFKNRIPVWIDILLLFILFFATAVAGDEVALSLLHSADRDTIGYYLYYVPISTTLTFIGILILHRIIDKRPLCELGLCTYRRFGKYSGIAIAWTLGIFIIGFLICLLSGSASVSTIQWHWKDLSLSLVMFTFGAFYEELIVRGYFLTRLCRTRLNSWGSLIISSMLFSILHLANSGISTCAIINLFLDGILMGYVFWYTKSLWIPTIAHCAWNWIQGPIFGFKVSGSELFQPIITLNTSSPNLINGGEFGFEGSIICTLLMVPSILIMIKLIRNNNRN